MILKQQTTSFEEIKGDLKTGDLVLMHGLHASSRVIEMIEDSPWSHVAMIVLAKDIDVDAGGEKILLWESDTQSPVKDVILNKAKSGPMPVKLSERLKYNFTHGEDSKLAVRILHTERNQEMFDALKKVIPEVHHAVFPDTYHEMLNPAKGRFLHEKTSLNTIFCSELAAYTYMKLGLLTSIHPVNSYTPLDFSDQLSVGLLKRAWLGNEIHLNLEETLV
jgi:hypothetical protein